MRRVAEQAEENKMTASNLGIIFGPTLVKPRQVDAEVSLSSLVDYPYQALMVELLVRHFPVVFDAPPSSESDAPSAAAAASQTSPVLTPEEKLQRLSRHSASLTDIKEVRFWFLKMCFADLRWNLQKHDFSRKQKKKRLLTLITKEAN